MPYGDSGYDQISCESGGRVKVEASVKEILKGTKVDLDMDQDQHLRLTDIENAVSSHLNDVFRAMYSFQSYSTVPFVLLWWSLFKNGLESLKKAVILHTGDPSKGQRIYNFGMRQWEQKILSGHTLESLTNMSDHFLNVIEAYPHSVISDPSRIGKFWRLMEQVSGPMVLADQNGSWILLESAISSYLQHFEMIFHGVDDETRMKAQSALDEIKNGIQKRSQLKQSPVSIANDLYDKFSQLPAAFRQYWRPDKLASYTGADIASFPVLQDLASMLREISPYRLVSLLAEPLMKVAKSRREKVTESKADTSESFFESLVAIKEDVLPIIGFADTLFEAVGSSSKHLLIFMDENMIPLSSFDEFFDITSQSHREHLCEFWPYLSRMPEYIELIKRKIGNALCLKIFGKTEALDLAETFLKADRDAAFFAAIRGMDKGSRDVYECMSECEQLMPGLFSNDTYRNTVSQVAQQFKMATINCSQTELFLEFLKSYLLCQFEPDLFLLERMIDAISPILFHERVTEIPRIIRMYRHSYVVRPNNESLLRIVTRDLGSVLEPSTLRFNEEIESWRKNVTDMIPEAKRKIVWCDWNWTFVVNVKDKEVTMSGLQFYVFCGNSPPAESDVRIKDLDGNIVPVRVPSAKKTNLDAIKEKVMEIMERIRGATFAQVIELTRDAFERYVSTYEVSLALNELTSSASLIVDDTVPRMYYWNTGREC